MSDRDEGAALAAPKTYSIQTIEGFFAVPKHRRDLMLHEFGLWMEMHDRLADLQNDPDLPPGLIVRGRRETFEWIDDDKGQARITIGGILPLAPREEAS